MTTDFVVWWGHRLPKLMLMVVLCPTAVTRPAPATRVLLLTLLVLSGMLTYAAAEPKALDLAQPHTNGLGMRFVPVVGTKALFSAYQTLVRDFRAFVEESGYVHMRETADSDSRMWSLDRDGYKQRGHSWENPGFKQTEDDPVVGVSWYEAKAFCEWLTVREWAAKRLPAGWTYRLPTDHEWSVAVGLVEEDEQKTPAEKSGVIKRFPWGKEWPPPAGAGNYAGEEAHDMHWPEKVATINHYKDNFARTAPVGSFPKNRHRLYDLGSNVEEWCEDLYEPGNANAHRVLRGASFSYSAVDGLLSSYRNHDRPAARSVNWGFRCVVGSSSP